LSTGSRTVRIAPFDSGKSASALRARNGIAYSSAPLSPVVRAVTL
jgi:hypothetical protein